MVKNRALLKTDSKRALQKLKKESALAKRGLRRLGLAPKVELENLLKKVEYVIYKKLPFTDKDLVQAIKHCDDVLETDPNNFKALVYRAECLYELHECRDAIEWYNKALEIEPENIGILFSQSACFFELERFQDGVVKLDAILEKNPNNAYALHEKAMYLFELKKYSEALECLNKILH